MTKELSAEEYDRIISLEARTRALMVAQQVAGSLKNDLDGLIGEGWNSALDAVVVGIGSLLESSPPDSLPVSIPTVWDPDMKPQPTDTTSTGAAPRMYTPDGLWWWNEETKQWVRVKEGRAVGEPYPRKA